MVRSYFHLSFTHNLQSPLSILLCILSDIHVVHDAYCIHLCIASCSICYFPYHRCLVKLIWWSAKPFLHFYFIFCIFSQQFSPNANNDERNFINLLYNSFCQYEMCLCERFSIRCVVYKMWKWHRYHTHAVTFVCCVH